MKRRRVFWILLGCVGFAVALGLVWPRPREPEPVYQGKKLSEWLDLYSSSTVTTYTTNSFTNGSTAFLRVIIVPLTSKNTRQSYPAENAVRQIGTNALPWLLKWVRTRESQWERLLDWGLDLVQNSKTAHSELVFPETQQAYLAVEGFSILGSRATPAVPELLRLSKRQGSGRIAVCAMAALGSIGPEAVPAFVEASTNADAASVASAISVIGMINVETNSARTVPVLISCLKDTRPFVARSAASALGNNPVVEPVLVTPALIDSLGNTNSDVRHSAAEALGYFGTRAVSARPALERALQDPDPAVREAVTNALLLIVPEALGTNWVSADKKE